MEDNFNLHKNIIDKIKTINYTNSYANWYSYEASQKLINKISNLFPQKQIKEEKYEDMTFLFITKIEN